jgi:hypothetical protein
MGMLQSLTEESIKSEVWIDGSFLTTKIDPDDVDIVVIIEAQHVPVDTAASAWEILQRIVDQDFDQPLRCDSYLYCDVPSGHPQYLENEVWRAYWIRPFCFTRKTETKGLVVVRTPLP